jgi:hypothetical protein
LAEELADDPRHAIAGQEGPRDEAASRPDGVVPQQQLQQHEQRKSLKSGLIELARMPWLRPAGREYHRPGHVGDPAPQLAIHEIRAAPEEQPDRHHRGDPIAEGQ